MCLCMWCKLHVNKCTCTNNRTYSSTFFRHLIRVVMWCVISILIGHCLYALWVALSKPDGMSVKYKYTCWHMTYSCTIWIPNSLFVCSFFGICDVLKLLDVANKNSHLAIKYKLLIFPMEMQTILNDWRGKYFMLRCDCTNHLCELLFSSLSFDVAFTMSIIKQH